MHSALSCALPERPLIRFSPDLHESIHYACPLFSIAFLIRNSPSSSIHLEIQKKSWILSIKRKNDFLLTSTSFQDVSWIRRKEPIPFMESYQEGCCCISWYCIWWGKVPKVNRTNHRGLDSTYYQSVIGSQIYAMLCTRPDIAFTISQLSQFNSCPTTAHLAVARRCLRYFKHMLDMGLTFSGSVGLQYAARERCPHEPNFIRPLQQLSTVSYTTMTDTPVDREQEKHLSNVDIGKILGLAKALCP